MKKPYYKICLIVVLGALPTAAFATYGDCRKAGGSAWECFWEAAWNDQIASPREDIRDTQVSAKYSEEQIKNSFARNSQYCEKVPVEKQYTCLSRGMVQTQGLAHAKEHTQSLQQPTTKLTSAPVMMQSK